ncbi:MAG: iron ABC transporter permease [bacterium]|nr:iron ABC transporter permease [bacterium]
MKSGAATLLILASVAGILIVPWVGQESISISALSDPTGTTPAGVILWKLRLPRLFGALLAGAALALCGAAFQAIFRNPLATPFTLGLASGSAFGVAAVTRAGLAVSASFFPVSSVAALVGALVAIGIVWLIARLRPAFSSSVLLLAGVAMNFFFSSLILVLQYTASLGDSYRIVRWLMGGLAGLSYSDVYRMLPFVVVGGIVILALSRELDLLSTGEDIAASRGVNVGRTRQILFIAASVMVGGIVAACGPIGFVGMMAPHMCRLVVGARHRHLLPVTALFGGAFLAICDAVARTVIAPIELPVGVITAFFGGPFFLWLLLRSSSTVRTQRR